MPSLKPVTRKHIDIDGKCNIKLRLCHQGKVRYIATPYYIEPEFMGRDGQIKQSYPSHTSLNNALYLLLLQANNIIAEQGTDIFDMDISILLSKLRKGKQKDFLSYTEDRCKKLYKDGRFSVEGNYRAVITSLKDYTGKDVIQFSEITTPFLLGFKDYLLTVREIHNNTVKQYIAKINGIINRALEENVIKSAPLRKIKMKEIKPEVKYLDTNEMKKLFVGPYPKLTQRAIDIFKLSFYLIGINLKDLCYLKSEDIKKGRLHYSRLKTKGPVSIKVPDQALEIMDKYKGDKYLLNFLKNDSYVAYKGFTQMTNKALREAGKISGIDYLTTYYARRSWASIASKLKIQIEVIDRALGHNSKQLIFRYVDYDLERIDEANEQVIKSLF